MRKGLYILIALVLILGLASGCDSPVSVFSRFNATADSIRFKEEYEALNSVLNEDGTNAHHVMSINRVSNVKYLDYGELMDFIDDKTGLLYFGRPACPWCRQLIPHMLEFAKEDRVDVYYYDIEHDRAENNDEYKSILAFFGEFLPTDTVTQDEDDPDFDESLKRVVLPHLFFLKDGKVVADLEFFQHESLRDGDSEKVKQLLRCSYAYIDSRIVIDDDCEC